MNIKQKKQWLLARAKALACTRRAAESYEFCIFAYEKLLTGISFVNKQSARSAALLGARALDQARTAIERIDKPSKALKKQKVKKGK